MSYILLHVGSILSILASFDLILVLSQPWSEPKRRILHHIHTYIPYIHYIHTYICVCVYVCIYDKYGVLFRSRQFSIMNSFWPLHLILCFPCSYFSSLVLLVSLFAALPLPRLPLLQSYPLNYRTLNLGWRDSRRDYNLKLKSIWGCDLGMSSCLVSPNDRAAKNKEIPTQNWPHALTPSCYQKLQKCSLSKRNQIV